ncbi:MAG: SusC/RagA family TonB-linked outer membrane protein [Candidatus Cyclobacteriaceae bacterium M3_2C_046]
MSKLLIYALALTSSFTFALAARVEAQQQELSQIRISITQGKKDLLQSLAEIERNSAFSFAYTTKELKHKVVNISKSYWRMDELLKEISMQTDLSFKRVNETITVREKDEKESLPPLIDKIIQTRNITGKVTSYEDGEGLPGVNVIEKGTSNGTVTDVQGSYSLEIAEGAVLVFSSVGYTTEEVEVGNRSVINLTMNQDIQQLQELVVVGYGSQKKSDITGSVVSFDPEILEDRPQTNLIQALQGNVAGVSITTANSSAEDNANIVIRGQNSITAGNQPLIILDGVPFNGSFSEINPNDVQSMEILKDASSTAIYGSRGANGVILITTRQGEEGKLKISYNGLYSFDDIANRPDMQNASQYWNDKFERNVVNVLSQPSNIESIRDRLDEVFLGEDTELEAFMMGYPGQNWDDFVDGVLANYPDQVRDRQTLLQLARDFRYPTGGRNTDWVDLATRTGHRQQHNLSFSGGSEDTKYFISGIYTNNQGIARGDKFERINFRVNLDQKILNGLNYGTNTQVGFYDRSGIKATWGGINTNGAFLLSPLYNPYNSDGSIDLFPISEDTQIQNPLEPLLFDNEDKETRILTNHYLNWEVPGIKGLSYKLNTGFSWNFADEKTYKGLNTVEGRIDDGNLSLSNRKSNSWLVENILSYTKNFGKHSIFLTALYSAQENQNERNILNGRGFPNDVMKYYQPSQADVLEADAFFSRRAYISQMLRANYSFSDRYLLTATVRRDGYSAFGADTKFGVFPSIAIGWNMSNENFMQNLDFIDQFKLRLSYGENGNEAISAYASLPRLTSLDYIDQNQTPLFGFFPEALSNPGLSWETTKSVNLGFDYSLFNGRISGSLDAYSSRTFDLLLTETISAVNGTTSIIRNIGETRNRGLEFMVSAVNIDSKDFSWKTDFNFSTYRPEIVHVGLRNENGEYIDDIASEWFIGNPVNVNFDYALDRILQKEDFILNANGEYELDENNNYQLKPEVADQIVLVTNTARPGQPIIKDVNGDGAITGSEDKVIHGNRTPDFLAGMTNTLRYKNLTFTFFLNGVWGVNKVNDLINNKAVGPKRKLNLDYWSPENPTNELPGLNAGSLYNVNNFAPYFDANFIRVQDVTLMYNFPVEKMTGLPFTNLQAYLNVKNAHTFTSWQGLDPEYDTQSDVPRARSFILGLRMSL